MRASLRSFASVDRFLAELNTSKMRGGYVLIGSEMFLYERARQVVLERVLPDAMREFALHDLELSGDMSVFDVLDLAQTPSLMAPFQVFFVRGVKSLYSMGTKKEEFAALEAYFRSPNPAALLLFIADQLTLPADLRLIDREDKERYDRIKETLGEWCGTVELQQMDEADAVSWVTETAHEGGGSIGEDAARELVDSLAGDMLQIASEIEKLLLYTVTSGRSSARQIELSDVETMVQSAQQRSMYDLTDAISRGDRAGSVRVLRGLLHTGDGEDAAIGHIYMLARIYRQMLVLHEKRVRDSKGVWTVLWPGFRMPSFAADEVVAQARRFKSAREIGGGLRLISRADSQLRSNPVSKAIVLERLVLALAARETEKSSDA